MADIYRKFSQDELTEPSASDSIIGLTSRNVNVRFNVKKMFDLFLPQSLKNPHSLTFTGAVSGSYDGSQPLSISIPYNRDTEAKSTVLKASGDKTGTTDLANIQNALNELGEGGIVELSNDIFYVNGKIEIPEGCILKGCVRGEQKYTRPSLDEDGTIGTVIQAVKKSTDTHYDIIHLVNGYSGIEDVALFGYRSDANNIKAYGYAKIFSMLSTEEFGENADSLGGHGIVYGHVDTRNNVWKSEITFGETLPCYVHNVVIENCVGAGLLIGPKTWCSIFDVIQIRRCSAAIGFCNFASDNTFSNLHLDNCLNGLLMLGTGNMRISNVKIFDMGVGFGTDSADITSSHGIYMTGSHGNLISNVEVQETIGHAIQISDSFQNVISNVQIDKGALPAIRGGTWGLLFSGSSKYNLIMPVSIINIDNSIKMESTTSNNAVFAQATNKAMTTENTITDLGTNAILKPSTLSALIALLNK